MPFKFEVSPEEKIIYITASLTSSGDRGDEDAAFKELISLPNFNPNYDYLVDYTNYGPPPSPSEMRSIASLYRKYRKHLHGRAAVVVNPKDVHKASILAMILRALNIRMEFYGDVESARKFLSTGRSWVK